MSLADELASASSGLDQAPSSLSSQLESAATEQPTQTKSAPLGNDFENFFTGAKKGLVDVGYGAKQLIDIPAVWLESKMPGVTEWSQTHGFPTAGEAAGQTQKEISERKSRYAPLMETTAGQLGNLTGNVAGNLLPLAGAAKLGVPLAGALANPRTYTAAAGAGALSGALQPTDESDNKLLNTIAGGAGGMLGNAAINAVSRVAQPVHKIVSDAYQKAVDTLENAGIPLDAAQKSGSAFLSRLKSSFFDNPFTAGTQAERSAEQQAAYNGAVLKTIGVENGSKADASTMRQADENIDRSFKNVLNKNNIYFSPESINKINELKQLATEEDKQAVANKADSLLNKIDNTGHVSGQSAYNIKKDLDRLGSTADTNQNYHARKLRSFLMDTINDSLPDADKETFTQARNQFRNMKLIEPAIDKMGEGNISPARLANVMGQKANRQQSVYGRGDQQLVDLAHAGNMLMGDKLPNSGTAARLAMQYALPLTAGVGAGASDINNGDYGAAVKKAALGVGAGIALPRMAQAAINNPAVANYLANGLPQSSLRDLLMLPQTNAAVGAVAKRGAGTAINQMMIPRVELNGMANQ